MSNPYLALAVPPVLGVSPYVPGKPARSLQRELGLTSIVKLASKTPGAFSFHYRMPFNRRVGS